MRHRCDHIWAVLAALAWPLALCSAQALAQDGGDQNIPAPSAEPALTPPAGGVRPVTLTEERIASLRKELEQSSDGEQHYRILNELSRGYQRTGRVAESIKVRDEIINDKSISVGRRSVTASQLALSEALIGNFPRSEKLASIAEDLARQTPASDLEKIGQEPAYEFLEAEAEIERRAKNRHDLALLKYQEHQNLAFANLNDASLSPARHQAAANELFNGVSELTRILVQNNRRSEALSYANSMRAYVEAHAELGTSAYQLARVEMAQSIALCSFDDYEAALRAADASIASFRRGGANNHDVGLGNALRMRLMIALALGRIDQYQNDVEELGRARAIDPVLAGSFPADEFGSLAYASKGQWQQAADQVGVVRASNARHQGLDSPFTKYESAMQMVERLSDPATPVAAEEIATYVEPLVSSGDDWAEIRTRGAYLEDAALAMSMDRLMQDASADTARAQALAFRIAELMRLNASQGALADGAARLAATDPQLRGLIEQEQALRFDQTSSRLSFAQTSDRLDRLNRQNDGDVLIAKRIADEVAGKQQVLQVAQGRLIDLRREISRRFPVYRELVAAKVPDAAAIGTALRPNEAYLNFYVGRKATSVFLIRSDGQLHAQRMDFTRDQALLLVQTLRRGFDAGVPPSHPGDAAGFDLKAAQALYQRLIAPLAAHMGGIDTVYISSGGVLSSLPFNVLASAGADVDHATWWSASVTPVLMPSGSAFVLERTHASKSGSSPMIAFADPSFDGIARPPEETVAASAVRERAIAPATGTRAAIDYHQVLPLPETYDEVRAIGQSVNASPQSLIRGIDATRTRVLRENMADQRVVVFATHGLLPGEVPGMLKAGLAMAYEGRGLQDSVLTIDDIVTLRLNADWVVLSACNTGYASGDAGDSISALARGFFAAGGRSLLVTQWAVESNSAKAYTTGLFNAYGQDLTLSKAGASAVVVRDMQSGKLGPLYRHPYFWGAYIIEGDAAR